MSTVPGTTSRRAASVVFLAAVSAASAVLVSGDQGDGEPALVTSLLAEAKALRQP